MCGCACRASHSPSLSSVLRSKINVPLLDRVDQGFASHCGEWSLQFLVIVGAWRKITGLHGYVSHTDISDTACDISTIRRFFLHDTIEPNFVSHLQLDIKIPWDCHQSSLDRIVFDVICRRGIHLTCHNFKRENKPDEKPVAESCRYQVSCTHSTACTEPKV